VEWGTQCLKEILLAAQAVELAPAAPIRMAIGANIAPVDLAMVRTRGMRAEVAGGLNVAATSSGEVHAGRQRAGYLHMRLLSLLT
jgi:hypothetical protein